MGCRRQGKKVLLRCDYNVPQDKETGAITSDKRIVAALPTIKYLLDNGASGHRLLPPARQPKGEWKMKLTLAPPSAERLSQLLGREVIFAKDIVGKDAKPRPLPCSRPDQYLLENLQFDIRLGRTTPAAKELADTAGCMSDAFGTVRAHASTVGVAAYLPAMSASWWPKAVRHGRAWTTPSSPLWRCWAAPRSATDRGHRQPLLDKADCIIIGGGMLA